jgi:Serine dehydrogenase proteinase
MGRKERLALIEELQTIRSNRLCVVYVTSTRPNHEISMADDVVRLLFDHLEAGREKAKTGVDLFIHSNGGQGTVPWRVVSLIREYTTNFAVLVPHKAFSAATLLAMGANEIVMHRMGNLGPIDPSVANIFNPTHPQNPGQALPISVEDVTAYFKLIQEEIGIHHEDELIQAVIALTEKIHPLALGNVQRSHHQARMMAKKLLKGHMLLDNQENDIDQIIDNLKSNLFYHGHPINRKEAREDLKLKVIDAPDDLADVMWKLYVEYENALKMTEPLQPLHELDKLVPPSTPVALTTQQITQQMGLLAQAGIGLPGVTPQQIVELAAAMVPFVSGGQPPSKKVRLEKIAGAYVESVYDTDVFLTDLALELATVNTPGGPQEAIKQEVIWQRWEKEK